MRCIVVSIFLIVFCSFLAGCPGIFRYKTPVEDSVAASSGNKYLDTPSSYTDYFIMRLMPSIFLPKRAV